MSPLQVVEHADYLELIMDDGKVNALSQTLLDALNSAISAAAKQQQALLLRGRSGCFSAGFDLKVMQVEGEQKRQLRAAGSQLRQSLLSHPAPIVMVSEGHAMAMGAFLLLCGDYRFGCQGAFRISLNETRIAMPMPEEALTLARAKLQPAWLNRAVLQAEFFSPAQALEAGFFDQVCSTQELLEQARTKLVELAALDRETYAETRRRLNRTLLQQLERDTLAEQGVGAA